MRLKDKTDSMDRQKTAGVKEERVCRENYFVNDLFIINVRVISETIHNVYLDKEQCIFSFHYKFSYS